MNKNSIAIACFSDNNFAMPLAVVIKSLLYNINQNIYIYIYIW